MGINSRMIALGSVILITIWGAGAVAQNDIALEKIEKNAVNRPLQSLKSAADRARIEAFRPGPPREIINFRGQPEGPDQSGSSVNAAELQDAQGTGATAVGTGFPGASNDDNADVLGFIVAPPDPDMDVGQNHIVQMINLLTTIYDKSGNIVVAPFPSSAFWEGIGGNCEPNNQGDPIVLYDEQAGRWLVSQFAFPDSFDTFSQCVAISQTEDPAGAYNRYEFSFDDFGFNDYPKHGVTTNSITMMANLFQSRGPFFNFAGTFLGVMDKDAMYAGDPAELIGFNIGTSEFGFVAGDLDGPGTAPNLFATAMSQDDLFDIWEVTVDWSTGDASAGRIASIPITPFDADLCGASREACIPQPEDGPLLEAISDRLMQRLQIRDFGTYRTMVTGHTVDVGNGRAGFRWYEFREQDGTWSLFQEGTFGPNDGENRWMPSVAMNAAGDLGIGYLLSSGNTFLSTAIAGQSAANSGSGFLDSEEQICAAGSGVQTDTSRAGDYSATVIDPVSDTFWHTNELVVTTGQFNWATFICEFAVGSGDGGTTNDPPTASFTSSCADLSCDFDGSGSSDSDGTIESYAWDFGDGTTGSGVTTSHTYDAGGDFTVTLTVTDDAGATDSQSQTITVSDGTKDPPVASYTFACTDLTCDFDGSDSTDSDGTIESYAWDFGDGTTGSGVTTTHTYDAGGDFTVTLTVTDDGGASDSDSQTVSVSDSSASISLSATGFKQRGLHKADLTWSGAESTDVDIIRDGAIVATTANDGAFTDNIDQRGSATYVYQVCEAGTDTCSNEATVTF